MFTQKDCAQREDFQEETDPTRREKRSTRFTGLRAAGEESVKCEVGRGNMKVESLKLKSEN